MKNLLSIMILITLFNSVSAEDKNLSKSPIHKVKNLGPLKPVDGVIYEAENVLDVLCCLGWSNNKPVLKIQKMAAKESGYTYWKHEEGLIDEKYFPQSIVKDLYKFEGESTGAYSNTSADGKIKVIKKPYGSALIVGVKHNNRESIFEPVLSKDGKRFAYCVLSFISGKQFVVIDGKKQPDFDIVAGVSFSPNGRKWAYIAHEKGQSFLVIDGRKSHKSYPSSIKFKHVEPNGNSGFNIGGIGKIYWSPNSRHFLASMVIDYEGGRKSILILNDKHVLDIPVRSQVKWSSNSRHYAYVGVSPDKENRSCAVLDGNEVKSFKGVVRISFSPNGRRFAFIASSGYDDLQSIVICDKQKWPKFNSPITECKIPNYHDSGGLFFSPDSRHLAYVGRDGDEWFVVCDGKRGMSYDDILARPVWENNKLMYIAVTKVEDTTKVFLVSEEYR
jgi:hypothetical protein